MSILDRLRRNQGRHSVCKGHHYHDVLTGWWCCSCKRTVSSRVGDRPEDTGVCRLPNNEEPPVTRDPLVWLNELTSPTEDTTVLPGTGKRRLNRRAVTYRAVAKVPGQPPVGGYPTAGA